MAGATYEDRRGEVETYFDRTAADAWKRLTSDAPVGRIRATVRAGRDTMRGILLSWLPDDLTGRRILDAGCGTGALSVEAAKRGAEVIAIDLSPTLVELARERLPSTLGEGSIDFRVGDMLDPALGTFDHVVSMDSLIHYEGPDAVKVLASMAERTTGSIVFTYAPRTPMLATMHTVGKLFPRSDRSPAIVPQGQRRFTKQINRAIGPAGWTVGRTERVANGFYISQALELVAP
jgi:magnesium-protoporphyrin O-methyltransferase